MAAEIVALASPGVHEKVFEIARKLPGTAVFDAPAGFGAYHIAPISYFELQFILDSAGFDVVELHANKYSSRNILSMMLRPFYRIIYTYKVTKNENRGNYSDLYKLITSDEIYYGETLIMVAKKKLS